MNRGTLPTGSITTKRPTADLIKLSRNTCSDGVVKNMGKDDVVVPVVVVNIDSKLLSRMVSI
jgi:hypothetical protein